MNKELKTLSLAVFHVFKLYGYCLILTTSINAVGIQHFAKDSETPPRVDMPYAEFWLNFFIFPLVKQHHI